VERNTDKMRLNSHIK